MVIVAVSEIEQVSQKVHHEASSRVIMGVFVGLPAFRLPWNHLAVQKRMGYESTATARDTPEIPSRYLRPSEL
jgi:hypothetical protein